MTPRLIASAALAALLLAGNGLAEVPLKSGPQPELPRPGVPSRRRYASPREPTGYFVRLPGFPTFVPGHRKRIFSL